MKVALISDYFYPFTPGGSEWSVYELVKALKKKGMDTLVITINYGSKEQELFDSLKIIRIPFFKKLKDTKSIVNPIWQNNPVFFLTSAYFITKIVKSENPDVINVHGKFLIPGSVIAGWITKKPVIVTIRDKQILCSIGKCFFDQKRYKACSFWEYLTVDFPWYVKNYTEKNLYSQAYAFGGVLWSRLAGEVIKFFANMASTVTTISYSQKKYMESNGFKNVKVIYNTANFIKPETSISKSKKILFVGKISLGKGVELLLDAVENLVKTQKITLVFAGSIQSTNLKNKLESKEVKPYVTLLGKVKYKDLKVAYQNASLLVMPSVYPESFGRAALEAISFGTPVVVLNTGALPEIIQDKITGRVTKQRPADLEEAIIDVLRSEKQYRINIASNYKKLKEKFMTQPTRQYINLYNQLIK